MALPETFKEIQRTLWNHTNYNYTTMDEVYPGIFVGGVNAATNINLLKGRGITHILNAAHDEFGMMDEGVGTSQDYYTSNNFSCHFLGVPAVDKKSFPIYSFFENSADFIEKALLSNGKILVHCYMGMSRSVTLVLAYLMIKKNMNAVEALKTVLSKRGVVYLNDGFNQQLCDLQLRLHDCNMEEN